jgi:hypothetical protein
MARCYAQPSVTRYTSRASTSVARGLSGHVTAILSKGSISIRMLLHQRHASESCCGHCRASRRMRSH